MKVFWFSAFAFVAVLLTGCVANYNKPLHFTQQEMEQIAQDVKDEKFYVR